MKRILITGTNGYIGQSFYKYIKRFPEQYETRTVNLRDDIWKVSDFSEYDVILHAVGLAHVKKIEKNASRYYMINRDLTNDVAKKACLEGIRQFVFLSSMSVYGLDEGSITPNTIPHPNNDYGKSKLEAECLLQRLQTDDFRVAILRPPVVYGDGCKGNYQNLVKLAKILPVCPNYQNQRSMISIINLCACIKDIVDNNLDGVFYPQDPEYVCTCKMIRKIALEHGKSLPLTDFLNFVPALLKKFTVKGKKAFGDLVYCDED